MVINICWYELTGALTGEGASLGIVEDANAVIMGDVLGEHVAGALVGED